MNAVAANVDSGQGASFRVQWTCSGSGGAAGSATCDDAKISVPVPTGIADSTAYPDGIPLQVTSQSSLQVDGAAISGAAQIVGTAPNQVLEWTFPATVASGASGTVSFTLVAPNAVTPDGTKISPVANLSATGAPSVTATATTVIDANISLDVIKRKLDPTSVPYVGEQVTYSINVGYDSQMPPAGSSIYSQNMESVCTTPGTQALENLKVVDTLLPGAQFVSANYGGVYDAGNNTVTWDLGSSIDDATHKCKQYLGATAWTGSAIKVTVVYPSPAFATVADPAIRNDVTATANAWGQPDKDLSADSSTTHGLREGASGASVAKSPGADWAIGNPLFRTVDTKTNHLYYLTGTSSSSQVGTWQAVDMLPCGLTSPEDTNDVDCANPAFKDIRFSADQYLPELDIEWTTNAGNTGVCTIPAGNSMSDTTRRYCGGEASTAPIADVPAGEWITKFEFKTDVPAFGGGHVYIHGTPSADIPTENLDTVYKQFPAPGLDRSDVHPWYVTVENCTAVNQIDFPNGTTHLPATPQTPASNAGPCGYRQVMTNPVYLSPIKSMYDASIPQQSRPAVPAVQTGDELTVDLQIRRNTWVASADVLDSATVTPTVVEYLPAQLEMIPDSLSIANGSAEFVAALGAPEFETSDVTLNGEPRTKLIVRFPNADTSAANSLGKIALVRFKVRVKLGTSTGTYSNSYLLKAAEAGPGIGDTYLQCQAGTMVDADLNATSDRNKAVGCLAQANFTVLPVPGVSTDKSVQGTYDETPVGTPEIGSTDLSGAAEYKIRVTNTGSVDIKNVVSYDLLPHVGDTDILPGSTGARGSEFAVGLSGPVTGSSGAVIEYSTSTNPCRGELAGQGGGATASAPAGCTDDWSATPPAGDYTAVTAIRVDFGDRVFAAGEVETIVIPAQAKRSGDASENWEGVAWNNSAVFAREASDGSAVLPTESSKVGLRMLPDLAWQKRDGDTDTLLGGTTWTLTRTATGETQTITDCTAEPCAGPDTNPAAGEFLLRGVAWGSYTLEETEAPVGYVPLDAPVEVELTSDNVDATNLRLDLGKQLNFLEEGEWTWTKTSNPESGTTVHAGQQVTYTLTASNTSDAPVREAALTDDLSEVLDDATFDAITANDAGRATRVADTIVWNLGTLAAGETRTVTYTVTVLPDGERGDNVLANVLAPSDVEDPRCGDDGVECTEHPVPQLDSWKGVEASETPVAAGTVLTYTLYFENSGAAPATINEVDYLTHVLDDATVTSEPVSPDGLVVTREGDAIGISGEIPAGETFTVTYQVTVKPTADRGDDIAANFLLPVDEVPPTGPVCQPTNLERPDCTLTPIGRLLTYKSVTADSDPVESDTVLTYTLTFDNQGKAAAKVDKTDHLGDVLDDATLVSAPVSSAPDDLVVSAVENDQFSVVGELAAGQTVTVTYQVKVKPEGERGNNTADNFLLPTGEEPSGPCEAGDRNCTVTPLPALVVAKTADPESGSELKVGDQVRYTLTFENQGLSAGTVDYTDYLGRVLDDASVVSAPAIDGAAHGLTVSEVVDQEFTVSGVLAPQSTVKVTYTVEVKAAADRGDSVLDNFLVPSAEEPPGPDAVCAATDSLCTTHPVGELKVKKSADPVSGATVTSGEQVTYTLTFANVGAAGMSVDYTDYLGRVLDDASVVSAPAIDGEAYGLSVSDLVDQEFTVSGVLAPQSTVKVTYTVEVKAAADRGDSVLDNFLLPSAEEPPGPDEVCDVSTRMCTSHPAGQVTVKKSADPKKGSAVTAGQYVTYSLTFTGSGASASRIDFIDDLSDVLDDAEFVAGSISRATLRVEGPSKQQLHITGVVAAGDTVTVSYRVKVKETAAQGNARLANYVNETGTQPQPSCADGDEQCTQHPIEPPTTVPVDAEEPGEVAAESEEQPGAWLPNTGGPALLLLLLGLLALSGGVWFVRTGRRRA